MNPYTLPEGNVQIAFSGGRTSAYMPHQILEANGDLPDRVEVTFQNTGREMPETLDFIQEVGTRWGVNIVWLEYRYSKEDGPGFERVSHNSADRTGQPFEALTKHRGYLPNQQTRFCTIELKVRTAKRYLMSLGWEHWINCAGLRADEPHRLNKPKPKDRWTVWHPLADANVSRHDVAAFWKAQPFDLRLPNVKGNCWLGNCDGCFLKSEANVAAFHRDFPERAAWWEEQEAWMADYWPSIPRWGRLRRIIQAEPELGAKLREVYGRPIRPSVISSMVENPRSAAQFSKRYSRRGLREYIENQGAWIFDTEDALCQADGGECFG